FATSLSLPGLASNRANRANLGVMRSMFKLLKRLPSVPANMAGNDRASNIDRQVCILSKQKRARLHALLLVYQFPGRVTRHFGGVRVALDYGGYDGPFNQNSYGRGDLRPRLANRLMNQSPQKLAEALLVPADELGAWVSRVGQFDGGVLKGAAAEP